MHRRLFIAAFAAAVLQPLNFSAAVSVFAECKIEIRGPSAPVKPGRFLRLTVSGDAEAVEWCVCGLAPDEFDAYQDIKGEHRLTTVLPGPGRYRFTAVGAKRGPGANDAPEVGRHSIEVICEGDSPQPNPNPTPNPGPQPNPNPQPDPQPQPPSQLGLRELAKSRVSSLTAEAKTAAATVAKAFADGAADIDAGGVSSVADLNTKTKARNAAAVGVHRESWVPVIQAIGARLAEQVKAGAIGADSLPDHAKAWREIAAGIAEGGRS